MLASGLFVAAIGYASGAAAAAASGTAFGYATGTTGGGNAAAVTPTSLAQVVSVLSDTTTRVVNIDRIWDFTNYYGTTTGQYCLPYTCTGNVQRLLNSVDGCGSNTLYSGTYYKAGAETRLEINSNKTVRGIGSNAGFKGIGIRVNGKTNVIVQNLKITDLNHQYVWGGDGISVTDSTLVWIDHNYVARTGRVLGYANGNSVSVTFSNNYFDGTATYSTGCDGYHYWGFMFMGVQGRITFAQNYVYHTSGRGPKCGGTSGHNALIHAYNNLFENIKGHAFDIGVGSSVLLEGNQFNNVTTVALSTVSGALYYVDTVAQAGTPCTNALGRTCEWNKYSSSGSVPLTQQTTSVLSLHGANSAVKSYKPFGVTTVESYVKANAGVGKV